MDGLLNLYMSGKVNNKKKTIDKGKITTTITCGSEELYEFCKNTEDFFVAPSDYVNNPNIIGMNDNVVSVNTCLEMDLTGQINAESIGPRQISGTGGHFDFVQGAYRSNGGKSFMAFYSTYKKKDGTMGSKIIPTFAPATGLTEPRSAAHYVVTDQGFVNLKGSSLWTRAEKMISVAHPDFRDQLIRDAEKLGIWKQSNKR